MRKRYLIFTVLISLLCSSLSPLIAQQKIKGLFRDESASGARAAMGLFTSPFNKFVTKRVFGINPFSLTGHISSVLIAAAGYQTIYYDKITGVEKMGSELFKENGNKLVEKNNL